MRVHYDYVPWSGTTVGTDRPGQLQKLLVKASSHFADVCRPAAVTGLPKRAQWAQVATLLAAVFETGLEEDVAVELQALLPTSKFRRHLDEQSLVSADVTLYSITWSEDSGSSSKFWLQVEADSLLKVLKQASAQMPDVLVQMKLAAEAESARRARWRAR